MKMTTKFSWARAVMALLLALFSSSAWSQEELTVYDGTTTDRTVPAYIYYFDDFTRSQCVFPAADLAEMKDGTITAIKFYTTSGNVPYTTVSTVDVYLKEVDYTSISAYEETSSCTTVYQGTLSVVTDGDGGSLTIGLATPFDYKGGNLLIGIENTTDTEWKQIYFYGQTVAGASISGSNGSSLDGVSKNQRNFLPKTTFTYTTEGFLKPKALNVNDLAARSATVSWTAPSTDVTGYVWQYKKASDTDWSVEDNTNNTSVILSSLTPETAYNFRVKALYGTDESGFATLDFITPAAIYMPTDVVVSNLKWNQVDIDWTDTNVAGTTWEIAYCEDIGGFEPGDDGYVVIATTKPFTLTDLQPEQTYEVAIRAINGTDISDWCFKNPSTWETYTFTTPTRYVVPTNLAASDITENEATIMWDATTEGISYNLQYRPMSGGGGGTFTYDFDDSTFDGWTTIDADGDGYTWELGSEPVSYLNGSIAGTGHGDSADLVVSGSYSNIYGALTPDNYLVSPQIVLGGSISFWACAQDATYPAEHFGVAVSTASNDDPDDFTTIASSEEDMTAAKKRLVPVKVGPRKTQGTWYQFEVDLSDYSGLGYVAIRHFDCTDQFLLNVDDIQIVEGAGGTPEPWTTVEDIALANQTLSGLEPDTQYEVQVLANYDGGNQSAWSESLIFTTQATYVKPQNLKVEEVKAEEATLSWVAGQEDQTAWDIAYMADGDADFTIISGVTTTTYILTGLTPETAYTVKVRGNHGTGEYSQWTKAKTFTTFATDEVPFNLAADNIMHTGATLSWTGAQDAYTLRYRTAAYKETLFTQDFEDGLGEWQAISNNENNAAAINSNAAMNGSYSFRFSSWTSASDYNQYLISPAVTGAKAFKFFYSTYGQYGPETFEVGYSSSGSDVADFTWDETTATSSSTTSWTEFTYEIPDGTEYVAIHYTSNWCAYLYIDDISVLGDEQPAGEWQTVPYQVEPPYDLDGLEMDTEYEWQVMGNDPDTEWSATATFTTLDANTKFFIADGDWDDENNWYPLGVPTKDTDVTIQADAIIPAGVIAYAKTITMDGGSITLKDLAELKTGTDDVPITIEKDINANQYYLLALPIQEFSYYHDVQNLVDGTYDIYQFLNTMENEWCNYRSHGMAMASGDGFLYANATSRTLTFTGTAKASIDNYDYNTVPFDNSDTDFYNGWKLVGNPFPCTAYLYCIDNSYNLKDAYFFKLNDTGTYDVYEYVAALAPGESVLMQVFEPSLYYYISSDDLGVANPDDYYLGEVDYPTLPMMWEDEDQDAAPTFWLVDDDDNTDILNNINGYSGINVGIYGRTLYTDGRWNTLCLPFETIIEGSPIEGASARYLNAASVDEKVLNLTFTEDVTLVAGTPYIVKWETPLSDNIENPIFFFAEGNAVAVNATPTFDEVDGIVTFVGTYAPVTFNDEDHSVLLMGTDSNLFYPDGTEPSWVNAFRGYFKLNDEYKAGNKITGVKMNFDDEATGIYNLTNDNTSGQDATYDLSGRRVSTPSKGMYIQNGKKVFIK